MEFYMYMWSLYFIGVFTRPFKAPCAKSGIIFRILTTSLFHVPALLLLQGTVYFIDTR